LTRLKGDGLCFGQSGAIQPASAQPPETLPMTETSAPVIVDARGLMPPEPLNLTLEALDTLPPGGEVILILYREPGPLYDILRRNGYTHRTETTPEGEFHIHIRHAAAA